MTGYSFPTPPGRLTSVLVATTALSRRRRIRLDDHHLRVRLGLGFNASIDRRVIAEATVLERTRKVVGCNGFGSSWVVATVGDHLVRIHLREWQRAWVYGWPVRLRRLELSVDRPQAFVQDLSKRHPADPGDSGRTEERAEPQTGAS